MKYPFLSLSLTLNVSTWTAAKNEVFKGMSFKPMGFLVVFVIASYASTVKKHEAVLLATTGGMV